MAKRANTGTPEYTRLVSIQLGWNQKLRVPNELMSQLLEILSQCTVTEDFYMDGGKYCFVDKGDPAIASQSHTTFTSMYAKNEEEAKLFVAYYNSTRKLQAEPNNFSCTIEEFRKSLNNVTE